MSTKELVVSNLLIELDCIFDTRLAVLASMGEDTLEKALRADYHERFGDIFPGIDNARFKELYENRTKDILSVATMTPMAALMREFAIKTTQNILNGPFHYQPKVTVNIWPYKLDQSECKILADSVTALCNGLAEVAVVDMAYEDITPKYVKQDVAIYVAYEYYKWLEVHSTTEAFKTTICPEVTMLGPAIFFKTPEKKLGPNDNPFESMEKLASMFISLQLMPAAEFSTVFRPDKT